MNKASRYSPEVRERAVRMVLEHQAEHDSEWAAMVSVTWKLGCSVETLRKWVRRAERDAGVRPGLKSEEGERLKALERENRVVFAKAKGYSGAFSFGTFATAAVIAGGSKGAILLFQGVVGFGREAVNARIAAKSAKPVKSEEKSGE